ncbi:condensin-2 complex subunit H2 [Fundulus heteroclitus]|uniref:condensin-2 complex subunit H2 n=1 Tax=Fundulus heteroclitus TaxID=8078 RepID=UPI00165A5B1F|nr:condensin-2 complex subunit H2 [Fundulus heteroclitus]
MEPAESRYAHLLQPIRELTKNWEIDVASELNDYLEELDETTITFDGGQTSLNFAEAALLIQGSTYIYSKKVELLHSLVCQTLEYINDKNKKKSQKAAQAQDNAAGASQSSHDADDMAVFTPLELEVSENSQKSDLNANVRVVPLPPESLIPPETHEKKRLPLISVKGEVVCSQKDFRMNLFIPGQDDLIQLILQSAAASRFLLDRSLEPPETQYAAEAEASGVPDDAAESFLPVEADMDVEQDAEEHVERQQSQAAAEGRMMRERRRVEVAKQEEPPAAVNVWAQHDPYSAIGEDKRFKAGRCYKVPEGLDDRGKRKRKPAALLLDFGSWFRGTCDPPKQKLKVSPTFPDLNYIYLSAIKHRVRNLKRIHRRAGVMMSEKEIQRTFLQLEEAGPRQPGAEPVDELLGGEDDGSDTEQDGFPDDGPAEFGADLVPAEARGDELTYEELVNLRVEQLVKHCQGYTQQTALSRRVKDWEDKIQPELVLQEQRPPFDIHDYGERIVEKLRVVGCRRTFASIVQGLDNFEACKFLLASLQLANDHTVEVDSAVGLEDSVDTMALTLLSTHRATDRFIALGLS